MQLVETSRARLVHHDVNAAEVVAFDDGHVYSGGTYALGAQRVPAS